MEVDPEYQDETVNATEYEVVVPLPEKNITTIDNEHHLIAACRLQMETMKRMFERKLSQLSDNEIVWKEKMKNYVPRRLCPQLGGQILAKNHLFFFCY